MKKEKAIIIGAGPAGLTAAYKLLKQNKNIDVTIFEELNQVGGISKTINYKGNRMDLGGHRFFSKSPEINELWNEIMPIQGSNSFDDTILKREKQLPSKGPNPDKEDNVMLIRTRVSRIYYLHKFFNYPVTLSVDTIKNLGVIRTAQSGVSYLKSIVFKKEETSLENFYINRFGKKLYSMFFEKYTEKLWGRHPKDISADWGAQRVKGISIRAVLKDSFKKLFHIKNKNVETSLIESFYYPKFGPGEFWEEMAKRIIKMGGKIEYNSKIDKINIKDKHITSVTCNNKEYKADYFISSMPIKDLFNSFNTKVNPQVFNIATHLPYRDFITIGVLLKKLNLKNKTKIKTYNDLIPDCWIYIQEPNVKMGRIQIFNNWSPYMVKDYKESVWIGLEYFCNESDDFWNMTDKEASAFAINELIKMGIIDNKEEVLDTHREKVKKAYPAYFDSYKEIDKVIKYLNKIDNLYCIGRNGQHRYNNMDHSMMCGIKAAELIITKNKDKSSLWNINTEKEYHEKK